MNQSVAVRGWGACVALGSAVLLQACGGSNDSSGTGQLRFINATSSHPSLALMASDAAFIGATALDAASAYTGIASGATSLQVTDAGSSTALATTAPTVGKDQHNVLLAYESNSVVKTWFFAEEDAAPATGTADLRVFDAAPDAGALDIYFTAPGADLAGAAPTLSTSTGSAGAPTLAAYSAFTPGTYEVRVTASGNKSDVRMDIQSVVIADQQVATLALTPTLGGVLLNGGVLVQQGAYAATRNPNVRVRLAAGVPGGVPVAASVGGVALTATGATSPSVGTYVLVPAAVATLSVGFGAGASAVAASVPVPSFLAGQDVTLLATGTASASAVTVLVDDNHLPASSTATKMRLVNGLSVAAGGTPPVASLTADFNVVAADVPAPTASAYGIVTTSATMQIDVSPPVGSTPLYSSVNLPAGSVYTMFMLGDYTSPTPVFRRDR